MAEFKCSAPDLEVDGLVPLAPEDGFETGSLGFIFYDESVSAESGTYRRE
jgi:hypothetical protein